MVIIIEAKRCRRYPQSIGVNPYLSLQFTSRNVDHLYRWIFLFNRINKCYQKIADEVSEISAQRLKTRIHTGSVQDVWHYLSATMNEIINRLQESFDLQKRFIANTSHELSTPLTSISNQLEIALQRERETNEYRKTIQSVLLGCTTD